jgi:hypothetical protein
MFKSNVRAKYSRKFGQTDLGRLDRLFFGRSSLQTARRQDCSLMQADRSGLSSGSAASASRHSLLHISFSSSFSVSFFMAIPRNQKAEAKKTAVFSRRAENW